MLGHIHSLQNKMQNQKRTHTQYMHTICATASVIRIQEERNKNKIFCVYKSRIERKTNQQQQMAMSAAMELGCEGERELKSATMRCAFYPCAFQVFHCDRTHTNRQITRYFHAACHKNTNTYRYCILIYNNKILNKVHNYF